MKQYIFSIILSVFSILTLCGQGIPYNTFGNISTPNPWDSRDSLTTLADTANVNPLVLYPGLEAWARDVGQKWLYNGTKWVFLYDSSGLSSNVAQDTSIRPTYLPGHNYTDGLLYAIKADFTRASAEFADSIHTTFIVGAPDPDSVYIQYAGRYTQVGHGYEVGKRYFLTDDTADQFDTIAGTFLDAVFVVIDANTLELLNQGVDINTTINRRVIPSPFITAYGGDPLNPTDSIIQAVVEGIYVPTGRATPGTIFLTQFAGASKNPAHQATSGLPSTPSNMWYWDGVLVTRNNFTQKAISLQDTAYGSLYTLPLDTVQLIAGVPTDSTVADWLEVNYTDNNLRLNNGTILYWRGTGTDQNPELSWQIVDFLTPPTTGDNWDAMIVRIGGEKWLATELPKGSVNIETYNSLTLGDSITSIAIKAESIVQSVDLGSFGLKINNVQTLGTFSMASRYYTSMILPPTNLPAIDLVAYTDSVVVTPSIKLSTNRLGSSIDDVITGVGVNQEHGRIEFGKKATFQQGAMINAIATEDYSTGMGSKLQLSTAPNTTENAEIGFTLDQNGDIIFNRYDITKLDTATHVLGIKFSEGGKLVPVLNSGGGGSGENIGNTDLTTDDDRILTTGTNTFTLDGTGQISIGDWSGNNNAQYLDINDTGNTIDIQSGGIITIGDAIGDYNGTTITVRDDNGNIIMNTSSGDILQTTTGGDLKLRSTTGSLILGDESVNSLVIDESTGVVSLSASDKVVANPDNEFTIISSDVNVTATNFNISALTLNLDTIPTDTAQFLLARQDNGNAVKIDKDSIGTWLKPELEAGNSVAINADSASLVINQLLDLFVSAEFDGDVSSMELTPTGVDISIMESGSFVIQTDALSSLSFDEFDFSINQESGAAFELSSGQLNYETPNGSYLLAYDENIEMGAVFGTSEQAYIAVGNVANGIKLEKESPSGTFSTFQLDENGFAYSNNTLGTNIRYPKVNPGANQILYWPTPSTPQFSSISGILGDSSLMLTLPATDVSIDALTNDLTISNSNNVEFNINTSFTLSDDLDDYFIVAPGAGYARLYAPETLQIGTLEGSGSITIENILSLNNKRIINVAPGIDTTDAINKNQLDSIITALETFTDSTTLTVNLEGKHNKIVEWDMTGVSNAGTITLAEPLNPFGSTTEAGVYTFVIFDCDTHDFDFPASFRNMGGSTAYDAGTTVEVVDYLSFTCYFNGTIYRCQ